MAPILQFLASDDHHAVLRHRLLSDPVSRQVLALVRALELPDCWLAAGFIRNAVWDHLHGRPHRFGTTDADIVWFDSARAGADHDRWLEEDLRRRCPAIRWSVKNQARMHSRNGDPPYGSAVDAMRHWPETATAVAVKENPAGELLIAAPYGLGDLFALVVRPTPPFAQRKLPEFRERITRKNWLDIWPRLRLEERPA